MKKQSVIPLIQSQNRFKSTDVTQKHNKKIAGLNSFRFKESLFSSSKLTNFVANDDTVMRGWAKFLINERAVLENSNLKFFQNPAFNEQNKKPTDEETEDQYGSVEIPGPEEFFFVANKKGLFALSSRRNDLVKTTKSMSIHDIASITARGKTSFTGGLEDLGNFQEGFCWKVTTEGSLEWIMCADSLAEKENWMQAIFELKGSAAVIKPKGKILEGTASLDINFSNLPEPYAQTGPDGEQIQTDIGKAPRPIESEWFNLQDWSSCTLLCGGGTQTLHRECHLGSSPEATPCQGEAILTRECNTQPCPPNGEEEESSQETLPMKVRMERVSTRPQRYETCIIKEGDLEIVREDIGNFLRPPRVPSRAVLNNMTFTVFQNVNFDTVVFSTELVDIELKAYPDDEGCFIAVAGATNQEVILCSLGTITGISPKANRDEWVQQIGFFRDNCKTPLQQAHPDLEIAAIKSGEVEEEQNEAMQRMSVTPHDNTGAMNNVAGMAIDAMSKEAKYEKLAESEELDREVLEELEQRKKMEQLKATQECMARDKRKAADAQRQLMSETQANDEVTDMRSNIKNMVMQQRAAASKKIAMMKKMADKKKRAAEGEQQELRVRMAKQAIAAQKLGDATRCDPKQSAAEKTKYCNTEFDTDPDLNKECKDPESFCTMCCENEIGLKYVSDRNNCMSKCNTSKAKGGNWVWVPESNQVKF